MCEQRSLAHRAAHLRVSAAATEQARAAPPAYPSRGDFAAPTSSAVRMRTAVWACSTIRTLAGAPTKPMRPSTGQSQRPAALQQRWHSRRPACSTHRCLLRPINSIRTGGVRAAARRQRGGAEAARRWRGGAAAGADMRSGCGGAAAGADMRSGRGGAAAGAAAVRSATVSGLTSSNTTLHCRLRQRPKLCLLPGCAARVELCFCNFY